MSLPLIVPPERMPLWHELVARGAPNWRLYEFIAEVLRQWREPGNLLHDTRVWYESAAAINDPGSRRFIHFFARGYLCAEAYRQTGIEIPPDGALVQRNSDALAARVLRRICDHDGAIPSFDVIGPIDSRAMTTELIPGRHLARTAWPAYGQWAWIETDMRFAQWVRRALPWLHLHLSERFAPTETFRDRAFVSDLTAGEKQIILNVARFCARYARRCQATGHWDGDLFALLRKHLGRPTEPS